MSDTLSELQEALTRQQELQAMRKEKVLGRGVNPMPKINYKEYAKVVNQKLETSRALAIESEQKRRLENIPRELEKWKSNLSEIYKDASLDNIDNEKFIAFLNDRLHRFNTGDGLEMTSGIFWGDAGTGKTYAAYAYAYELIKAGHIQTDNVQIIGENLLSDIASSGFNREQKTRDLFAPRYKYYFVDEVGRSDFKTDEVRAHMWFQLADHVMKNGLTLVLATNLTLDKKSPASLRGWIGDAASDRIGSIVGKAGIVNAGSENMRAKIMKTKEQNYASRYKN